MLWKMLARNAFAKARAVHKQPGQGIVSLGPSSKVSSCQPFPEITFASSISVKTPPFDAILLSKHRGSFALHHPSIILGKACRWVVATQYVEGSHTCQVIMFVPTAYNSSAATEHDKLWQGTCSPSGLCQSSTACGPGLCDSAWLPLRRSWNLEGGLLLRPLRP